MDSQLPTATGTPATYRSPLLERRRRATLAATNPDLSAPTSTASDQPLSPSLRRLSQHKQSVADLSLRLKGLFSFLKTDEKDQQLKEEGDDEEEQSVLDSDETIAIGQLERSRARTTSAQRVSRRVSMKITTPSLSHKLHLMPTSATHSGTATPRQRPSVIESHDFYNADFSNQNIGVTDSKNEVLPASAPSPIDITAKDRPSVSKSIDAKTSKFGSVFIDALSSITQSRNSAVDVKENEPQITYTAPSKRMTPRSSISSNISITVPIDALKDATPSGIAATTKKPPTASAPQISNIDVRDMFPQDFLYASKQEGLVIFRIENMRPELLEKDEQGHFCIADCYVIISTTTDDPHLQHYNNTTTNTPTNQQEPDEISADHLIHTIYTWIGPLSELDKRFCCAMFAVGVKNLLGIGSRVIRQAQNEESKEFIGLFGSRNNTSDTGREGQDLVGEEKAGIIYDDESYAAESGLFIAERRMFQLRVYRVSGKPRVRMTLVEPARKSLESCNVYLIDGGHDLIQWNGKESCLTVRTKCRMLMSIINGSDRVGKAFLLEIEEGEESEKLEKILPRDSVGQDDHLNPESFVAMIYKIPEGPIGEMNDVLIAKDENDAGFSQTILDAQECCILDAGVEIYLWIGSKATAAKKCFAPEVLARVIRSQPTRPSYLSLQRITQHNEPESFKLYFSDWIEQRTQQHIHQTRVSLLNRPTPLKVDVRALYAPHPLLLRVGPTTTSSISENRFILSQSLMETANKKLVAYNAFSFERGRFVKLETVERGGVHLCMEGQYVFLCVYRGEGEADQDGPHAAPPAVSFPNDEDELSDAMNKALVLSGAEEFRLGGTHFPVVESYNSLVLGNGRNESLGETSSSLVAFERSKTCCVAYFWVGRMASKVSEKTFRFHARHELEEAIRKMYHCSVQIVHVSQEREPLELLAHWGNRSVVHRGTRKALLKRLKPASSGNEAEESGLPKSVLYHIRTDWKYKTTRAIQVPCVAERLISRDCFYIHELGSDPGVGFLWTGKNSTAEDARKALAVCDRISSFYISGTKVSKRQSAAEDENGSNLSLNSVSEAEEPLQELSLKPSVSKQQNILSKQFRIVGEGLEPRAYFQLFPNGKQPYCTGAMPPALVSEPSSTSSSTPSPSSTTAKSILLGTSVVPTNLPRLLICSCVKGYFTVEELPHFDQLNLDTSNCAILDPGPHSPVYLWNGSSASDVVVKLSRKAVEVWLETLDDGRRNWEGEMATGESVVDGVVSVREGAEGYEFRALFHAWIQMDK